LWLALEASIGSAEPSDEENIDRRAEVYNRRRRTIRTETDMRIEPHGIILIRIPMFILDRGGVCLAMTLPSGVRKRQIRRRYTGGPRPEMENEHHSNRDRHTNRTKRTDLNVYTNVVWTGVVSASP